MNAGEELVWRAGRQRRRLRRTERVLAGRPPHADHADALAVLLKAARRAVRLAAWQVEKGGADGALGRATLATAIASADAAQAFVAVVLDQRRDPKLGPALRRADRVVADGYAHAWRRLVVAGVADDGSVLPCPPICVADAGLSPATYERAREVRTGGWTFGGRWTTPLPLVFVPPDQVDAPWWHVLLLHEVGHCLDHELGLTAEWSRATPGVAAAHVREFVADMFGLCLGGPGYPRALRHLADLLPAAAAGGADHPPLAERLDLLAALQGSPPVDARVAALAALPRRETAALEHRALTDVLPFDSATQQGARMVPGVAWSEPSLPPGDLRRAVHSRLRDAPVAELPHVEGADRLLGSRLLGAAWRGPTPTRLRPPAHWLRTCSAAAFVGVTCGQLADALRQAWEARGGAVWRSIAVYLVTEERLPAFVVEGQVEMHALAAERARALAELPRVLSGVAETWRVGEFGGISHVGSCWDWGAPGGRVHLKPYVAGVPIGNCPFVVYRWQPELVSPAPAYHRAVASLEAVWSRARILASTAGEVSNVKA